MIKIYGIKNCDTMKKAVKWMDANSIEYDFHDYRKDGISEDMVANFVSRLGLELVLNKRGTTWRKLPDDIKDNIDEAGAIKLMVENEAMIKRPIFDLGDELAIGFSKNDQAILEEKLL
ncbi:ArsC family reductase [Emcibacteraceae bacterium]|jgi:arsenate reductase|uniref:ArsC family reductase n=1 Tax=Pseudemcibacter sp. TaxID=2943293 RepID=UPI002323E740|nr:ArsC family reductase [Emcibacteraceae bacterium]MDG1019895.1 ArsC family reductase [Emcibacteraceae bacterium]MDG1726215.1 ArsC family reductase [Emcibacteraceae bacterium]